MVIGNNQGGIEAGGGNMGDDDVDMNEFLNQEDFAGEAEP